MLPTRLLIGMMALVGSVWFLASDVSSAQDLVSGDVDCDGDADSVDAQKVLRHVAALSVSQAEGCPKIGSEVASLFGDVDCDNDVDAVDSLRILQRVAAGTSISPAPGCPTDGGSVPTPDTYIDLIEDPQVRVSWPQVPEGDAVAVIGVDEVVLSVRNTSLEPQAIAVELEVLANGRRVESSPGGSTVLPGRQALEAGETFTIAFPLTTLGIDPSTLRSPGLMVVEVQATAGTGERFSTGPEQIYFHGDEGDPGMIVVYGADALKSQLSTMTFERNPSLSRSLAAVIPADQVTTDLGSIAIYDAADPILAEEPVDEIDARDELDESVIAVQAISASLAESYFFCLKWYVSVYDNGFGEDKGKTDGGWRARGAHVKIYQGNFSVEGWLNEFGCGTFISDSTADIGIWIYGDARLESGGGFVTMERVYGKSETARLTAWTSIKNPQPNTFYYPVVTGWDGFGVLSYIIQERFNGGVSGKTVRLIKKDCGGSTGGSCSTFKNGAHYIFLDPNKGWRRKFIAGHEWGHKALSFSGASYKNDCSYNGGGHGMKTIEYGSCAAMEGWAHFVAANAWNNHPSGTNPGGVFVYWNAGSTVYDVESGSDVRYCLQQYPTLQFLFCGTWGYELDWMRHWWDFHSNDVASSPGSRPSHSTMMQIVDDTSWKNGPWSPAEAVEDELSGSSKTRWRTYGCANGVDPSLCL